MDIRALSVIYVAFDLCFSSYSHSQFKHFSPPSNPGSIASFNLRPLSWPYIEESFVVAMCYRHLSMWYNRNEPFHFIDNMCYILFCFWPLGFNVLVTGSILGEGLSGLIFWVVIIWIKLLFSMQI